MVAGRRKNGRVGDSFPAKEVSEQNRFAGYMSEAGPMGIRRLSGTTKDGILLVFGIIILSPRLLLFGLFGVITMVILTLVEIHLFVIG